MLIDACAAASAQSPNAISCGLLFLGDGVERDSLVAQTARLKLGNSVTFLSGKPWFKVPEILALSDVLVLPSRSEPWGLVVNEAMVCGLPVIVSARCGCVIDLVHHGQTGFVIDPDQPAQLTHWLLKFMNQEVDVVSMKKAAETYIAPYSPDAVAEEMLQGFLKIKN